MDQQGQQHPNYHVNSEDYITFKPATVKYISEEQMHLAIEYSRIISALREKNMVVKEIYELYRISDTERYEKTIKTIYRYLEKLETAELVIISGYRKTRGTKIPEKLYSRTANLFYPDPTEEGIVEREEEILRRDAHKFFLEHLQGAKTEENAFYTTFNQFSELQRQVKIDMLELAKNDPSIAEFFSQIRLDNINSLQNSISAIAALLQQPELLEQFQQLFET